MIPWEEERRGYVNFGHFLEEMTVKLISEG